jgi:hypothetical protein
MSVAPEHHEVLLEKKIRWLMLAAACHRYQ